MSAGKNAVCVKNFAASEQQKACSKRIYKLDGDGQILLTELDAHTFLYWHRRVEKDRAYIYAITAMNDEGREGEPTYIKVQ
jgi:hypothetical protein